MGSGVISLPHTGQTKCYDTAGAIIACPGTGQDGELKMGVDWPNPRFSVTYCNSTGPCATQSSDCDSNASTDVVLDNLTGLVWSKSGNLPNGTRTWQGALDYVASLNSGSGLCGYKNWRLANVNELESLINAGEADSVTWLNSQAFINVQPQYYWSSTSNAYVTGYAWIVEMWDGYVGYDSKSGSRYVWLVRSGQ